MQIQMMDHTMEVWRQQIKSWPSRSSPGNWLDAETFKAVPDNTAQFWTRMGEQWQKNWAQMMMSQWVGLIACAVLAACATVLPQALRDLPELPAEFARDLAVADTAPVLMTKPVRAPAPAVP